MKETLYKLWTMIPPGSTKFYQVPSGSVLPRLNFKEYKHAMSNWHPNCLLVRCQTPYLTGKNLYNDEITHLNRYIKIRSQLWMDILDHRYIHNLLKDTHTYIHSWHTLELSFTLEWSQGIQFTSTSPPANTSLKTSSCALKSKPAYSCIYCRYLSIFPMEKSLALKK